MQVEFDDGTLLLRNAPDDVPYGEWDDRVDEYRTRAYRYRALLEWAGKWTDGNEQATLQEGFAHTLEDTARAYPDLDLTQALHIEPRDYQQAALDAWIDHDRRGSVVLPTGSGKTFLGLQAIADAGVSTLVVTPTIDLMNQWHATLTNAFGDQLTEPVGVLGGGSHDVTAITVTTYDSAYRYVNEYGDQFGLLVVDEEHHLPAPTYRQIPEMIIAPYRLGLTATYERPDGKHELLEDLLGPVVYRKDVDELAGEYLSEYETIHMSVDLTADEREEYDEEYQIYRDYVDSHEFDLWKEDGYAEFLKRTSYDPQGRRALIAKQRAERIARTAEKKLDTLDNLLKRHHDDRTIIFTANNDFATTSPGSSSSPVSLTRPRLTNAPKSSTASGRGVLDARHVTGARRGHRRPGGKRRDHPLGERLETPVRATAWPHPATHGRPPARAALRDHHRGYDGDVRLPTPP